MLDDKLKPQTVDISFENEIGSVNVSNKGKSESFILDGDNGETMLNCLDENINSRIDLNNISGGKMYKYRNKRIFVRVFLDRGLNF